MRFNIFGNGNEFTLGFLDETQLMYIKNILKKSSNDFIEESIWETETIPKPWNEIDDLIHCYGALYDDNFYIKSDDGHLEIYKSSEGLGKFEIDYHNDDRLEFLDDNKKLFIGWNQLGTGSEKGFKKLNLNDFNLVFQNKFTKGKFKGGLLGVKIYEQGNFGEFELPDKFDISKLIITYNIIKFGNIDLHNNIKYLTNIFYDGKKIFVEQDGNTVTTNSKFFIIEPKLSQDQNNVTFDFTKEFKTISY